MCQNVDVAFLCQYFYPEYNSSATLPWDLAQNLAAKGLKVIALCGYPNEYVHANNIPEMETCQGVQIKRIHYLHLNKKKKISRLMNFLSFMLGIIFHLKYIRHSKVVLVYSNPPVLPFAAVLAKKIYKTKIVFISYDVYPEIAYASGSIGSKGMVSRVMTHINKRLFTNADGVVALTDEMKEYLLEHRPELVASKVRVIANWAYEGVSYNDATLYKRFHFPKNAFVVSYFGNLGICQDIETLAKTIRELGETDNIYFLICGSGAKKDEFMREVKNCPNVRVADYLLGKDFEDALAISSCGVVSLEPGLKGMCAPSKYYSYLQAGLAVLAITESDSYLVQEIQRENIGYAVSNGESQKLAKMILDISEDPECLNKLQNNSFNLYRRKYDRSIAIKQYMDLIEGLLKS